MDIIISNSGGVPIYDQITRQMKGLILRGAAHLRHHHQAGL